MGRIISLNQELKRIFKMLQDSLEEFDEHKQSVYSLRLTLDQLIQEGLDLIPKEKKL